MGRQTEVFHALSEVVAGGVNELLNKAFHNHHSWLMLLWWALFGAHYQHRVCVANDIQLGAFHRPPYTVVGVTSAKCEER